MTYRNVVAAVVRALASDVLNSAGGCDFEPRVQSARIPGALSGKDARLLDDGWVRGRLHSQLTGDQYTALVAFYSGDFASKIDAAQAMAKRVKSPAPERFITCATVTWAAPKRQGVDGKRSTSVLPAGWYCLDNWCDDPISVKTQERWRREIRKALKAEVDAALEIAQDVLEADGLLICDVA
ncbi:hypothetical protein [Pseudomonas sp.]|uniref:hypothetical protein n=1 Tax=Pseudomonas sp. TaxID=306 RepID=UPI002587F524|nr:hypothetical protein [Pseudomonas sp.]